MRVEDLGAVRHQAPDLLVVAGDQLQRAFEDLGHPGKLTAREPE